MNTAQQQQEMSEEFADLFLVLSTNQNSISATCSKCNQYVQTDIAPTRYAIQSIRQIMKLFYCSQLQFDCIPWGICEKCYGYICPSCIFGIIIQSLTDGMLTTHCSICNQDYSYSDVMDTLSYGEVLVFNYTDESNEEDKEPEFDQDEYELIVRTSSNELEQECPICLTVKVRIDKLRCGHAFCRDCLFKSLTSKKQCPMCRQIAD